MSALPSFCIALPVYNEAAVIESCIDNIARFLDTVDARTGIIAVDDGSADDSFEIMRRMQDRLPQLVVHRTNAMADTEPPTARSAVSRQTTGSTTRLSWMRTEPRIRATSQNFFPLMCQGVDFIKATRYRLGGGVDGVPWQR